MHIDQRREPGPPDSGKPERCGRKGTPAICFDTQTTFPSIRAASAWADPAGRHGKRPVICSISAVLAGRAKTAGGRRWAHAEAEAAEKATMKNGHVK